VKPALASLAGSIDSHSWD